MKLLKLSFGMLVILFFAAACSNNEPAKVETIHITTPAEKKTEEPAKEDVKIKVGEKGVEFEYEKKD